MKRIFKLEIVFLLVISMIFAIETPVTHRVVVKATSVTRTEAIAWVKSKVNQSIDADGVYGAQCVDLIRAYYSYLGVAQVSGNGCDYATNSLPSGWSRVKGGTPQQGDILVYSGNSSNPAGHVAIYESDYATYHQNFASHAYVEKITTIKYNGFTNAYWGYIRPNWSGGKWYDSMTPVDIGTDIYASLLKNEGWQGLGNSDGNVIVQKNINDGANYWRFVRQSDKSYIVYNCLDNKVLSVENSSTQNGGNVCVKNYSGLDSQKWFIYGRWSGEWYLRPKNSDKVLNVGSDGNAQIWAKNDSAAQKMALYKFEKVGASTISVSKGDSAIETSFVWSAVTNTTHYNLRIFTGTSGSLKEYKTLWKVKTTSAKVVLPAGYYEVYVDSCNSYSYTKSNVLKFNISEHAHTFTYDGKEQKTCKTCGETNPNLVETTTLEVTTTKPTETTKEPTASNPSTQNPTAKPVETTTQKSTTNDDSYAEWLKSEKERIAKEAKKAKVTIKKLKNVKGKKAKITWKASNRWNVSGYQIMYARNKKFTKGKKVKNVYYGTTTSKTLKGLKKKKTYYFKIRAYITDYASGNKVYGKWSKVKKVKIKK